VVVGLHYPYKGYFGLQQHSLNQALKEPNSSASDLFVFRKISTEYKD
jgi:hypothetical protein